MCGVVKVIGLSVCIKYIGTQKYKKIKYNKKTMYGRPTTVLPKDSLLVNYKLEDHHCYEIFLVYIAIII